MKGSLYPRVIVRPLRHARGRSETGKMGGELASQRDLHVRKQSARDPATRLLADPPVSYPQDAIWPRPSSCDSIKCTPVRLTGEKAHGFHPMKNPSPGAATNSQHPRGRDLTRGEGDALPAALELRLLLRQPAVFLDHRDLEHEHRIEGRVPPLFRRSL